MIGQGKQTRRSWFTSPGARRLADLSVSGRAPLGDRLRLWLVKTSWRYRYLLGFISIGFLSILLETALVALVFPSSWPRGVSLTLGFLAGMLFAYFMNVGFNFAVPRKHRWHAFGLFCLVSTFSYGLNCLLAARLNTLVWTDYPTSRFFTAGCLFMVAYYLHCRLTFRHFTRNLGLAVYATAGPDLQEAYERVGELCDHIHMDLIDETMKPGAPPVDLRQLAAARDLWKWHPISLHVMSRTPLKWVEECHPWVDQVLVHIDGDDDVMEVITRCRQYGLKVGVAWHHTVTVAQVMPYLPHVDFVLVLGIEKPGCCGQTVMSEALRNAQLFESMADHYNYQVIFDGGVTTSNLETIAAPIVISSSHVLKAKNPVVAALCLMAGGAHVA